MNHFVEQLLGGNLRRWQATYEGGPIHLSSSSSWATLKGPGNGCGRHGIALPQQSAAAAWSLAREFATLVLVRTVAAGTMRGGHRWMWRLCDPCYGLPLLPLRLSARPRRARHAGRRGTGVGEQEKGDVVWVNV